MSVESIVLLAAGMAGSIISAFALASRPEGVEFVLSLLGALLAALCLLYGWHVRDDHRRY